ncbi:MAG: bifunctional hydroxymethylpyrimidine kinase/phosphomethylpyrimidine kinase [Myxococcales bacterium]|nr:bifunctional hydroxymethylpyrimidine kinase/phosphomethylpyrimidine kinase [Myxococcota bacterium]MDW8281435.1 bifunctional hydroxymethylpyrimidine kinase/phosphomethylpyrimidine kinase [Myxococcales bacterium]
MTIPIVLSIAGSDPSGGAGIQADLKALSALGCYGATVLTALTAQNTCGVRAIYELPPDFVAAQLEAVLSDLDVAAIKIGMLGPVGVVRAVARGLESFSGPIVLDPVMVAKSGAALLQPDAVGALRDELLPRCHLLTPNLPEAAALLGVTEEVVRTDREGACLRLQALGARAVLLKGGHLQGDTCEDLLWDGRQLLRLSGPRIATRATHGTGCTLSSAIAAWLAHGRPLEEAAALAKEYLTGAIRAADCLSVGNGQGPVHHFYALW